MSSYIDANIKGENSVSQNLNLVVVIFGECLTLTVIIAWSIQEHGPPRNLF